MVYTTQTREYEEMTTHPVTCYTLESCTLTCPDVNLPAGNIPNITINGTIWHKVLKHSIHQSYQKSSEAYFAWYICSFYSTVVYHSFCRDEKADVGHFFHLLGRRVIPNSQLLLECGGEWWRCLHLYQILPVSWSDIQHDLHGEAWSPAKE